jgi:hypothetical protein
VFSYVCASSLLCSLGTCDVWNVGWLFRCCVELYPFAVFFYIKLAMYVIYCSVYVCIIVVCEYDG